MTRFTKEKHGLWLGLPMVALWIFLAGWASSASADEIVPTRVLGHHVAAYYFHGNYRCATCTKLEKLSREAISDGFSKNIRDGRLVFRVVNVETPENRHFSKDYQLYTRSLVLVERNGDKDVRYKNLQEIWGLVRDPQAFGKYVQRELADFLKALDEENERH